MEQCSSKVQVMVVKGLANGWGMKWKRRTGKVSDIILGPWGHDSE